MAGEQKTNDLWDAIYTQRAIRRWTDEPVSDDVLHKVIEAGTKAPSGTNSQPWRFLVVRDQGLRTEIARLVREAFDTSPGLNSYIGGFAKAEDKTSRLMGKSAYDLFRGLEKAPVHIIPCLYRGEGTPPPTEQIMAGSSIYTAAQNILLAGRGLGLGTVMTTMQSLAEPAIRELLAIPENAKPVALIPLGWPDGKFGPTTRKPVSEVMFVDRWTS